MRPKDEEKAKIRKEKKRLRSLEYYRKMKDSPEYQARRKALVKENERRKLETVDDYLEKKRAANRVRTARYRERHRERLLLANREKTKRHRENNPVAVLNYHFKSKYGITAADYEAMLKQQNGVCAICGAPPGDVMLHIDHDHDTGAIRGLLCRGCNSGLGFFRDDQERMMKAIEYLKTHSPRPLSEVA